MQSVEVPVLTHKEPNKIWRRCHFQILQIRAIIESVGRLFRATMTQHRQKNSDNQSKKGGIDPEDWNNKIIK